MGEFDGTNSICLKLSTLVKSDNFSLEAEGFCRNYLVAVVEAGYLLSSNFMGYTSAISCISNGVSTGHILSKSKKKTL